MNKREYEDMCQDYADRISYCFALFLINPFFVMMLAPFLKDFYLFGLPLGYTFLACLFLFPMFLGFYIGIEMTKKQRKYLGL